MNEFFNALDKFPRYMNTEEREYLLHACVPWCSIVISDLDPNSLTPTL